MKISKLALLAAAACMMHVGGATAADNHTNDRSIAQVGFFESHGCDDGACDSGCDSHGGYSLGDLGLGDYLSCGDCCIGDPYEVFGDYYGWHVGGWGQLGYHSSDSPRRFNDDADGVRLQQAWLYAERAVDGSCGLDIGGRIDLMYGIDGPDTQAFGPNDDSWDQDWDNGGSYGWALPQLYAEVAYGDLSVKAGHFYTIIGYESVMAPQNFFYSHTYTMVNNEPFTHTGILATYQATEDIAVYGGYTLGWDSGFEDNGDTFLGGFSLGLTEDVTFTYGTTIGRFNTNFNNTGVTEQGYMHSMILDVALTNNLQWVSQFDWLDTERATDGARLREGGAFVNYLFYALNDCTSLGVRHEYFQRDPSLATATGDVDVNDLTFGVNHRMNSNLIVRPELRWDWDDAGAYGVNENNRASQTTFGVDAILTF
ncbi:porin [Roseimaritima sediminicola]|uniref:porin n=1 Tax=Roseimaritima sediminicola TaxID=2662066 RepID=UPI001F431A0B|nr:porin [Roseimaritima sediminicola]